MEPDKLIREFFRTNETLLVARRSLVQHLGKQSSRNYPFHESPTFQLPWFGPEEDSLHSQYRVMAEAIVRQPLSSRASSRRNRGIVICAGGMKYFTCAWITVRMLRRLGCRLPIELWHLGPEEMTPEMLKLADRLKVKCVDAHEVRKEHPARRLGGWELKCYAILHSRFREVLLMDADNVPVVDPTFLFQTREYQETGAIFWPDIGSLGPEKDIWKITGVPYNPQPDFESGQIVVDKPRCWKAMQLAMHYNEHSDFYYQYIYGDKDTFRFAFLKTGTPFSMPRRGIEHLDGTLCQHDFEGRRIFQHRIKKWSLGGRNKPTEGFLHEVECLGFLDELRQLWQAGIPAAAGPKDLLIPRILHRLWLGPGPLSAAQRRWARSWKKQHPQWEEKVWTADHLPELINRAEFDRATDPQQRMEIASYELLHRFGGLYVDADFECLRSLESLLAGEECVLGEESPGRICHGLIACVPGHELLKELVRGLSNSVRDHAGKSIVEQTGANYVTRKLRDRWDATVLPASYFHPHPHGQGQEKSAGGRGEKSGAYAIHHPAPRWMPDEKVEYRRRFARFDLAGKTGRERAAVQELTRGIFDYHRIGYDRRTLQFLPDGTVGEGAAGCERAWDVSEEKSGMRLSLFGPGFVTCTLERQADGCWQGAWLICEKMPVELTAVTVAVVESPAAARLIPAAVIETSRPGNARPALAPLVSAIMITGKSPAREPMARVAVEAFLAQTHPRKELVIVNHGGSPLEIGHPSVRELVVPPGERLMLGDLRNLGLSAASGEWVLQWDDDDWHAPERMAVQLHHAHDPAAAVLLRSQIRYCFQTGAARVLSLGEGIDGTILHHRLVAFRYPSLAQAEDSKFAAQFAKRVVVPNDAALYVRFVHGANTWSEKHIMGELAGRRADVRLSPGQRARLFERILPRYGRGCLS